jgi:hypothetical protein
MKDALPGQAANALLRQRKGRELAMLQDSQRYIGNVEDAAD